MVDMWRGKLCWDWEFPGIIRAGGDLRRCQIQVLLQDRIAQGFIQPDLENFQGRGLCGTSGNFWHIQDPK